MQMFEVHLDSHHREEFELSSIAQSDVEPSDEPKVQVIPRPSRSVYF